MLASTKFMVDLDAKLDEEIELKNGEKKEDGQPPSILESVNESLIILRDDRAI